MTRDDRNTNQSDKGYKRGIPKDTSLQIAQNSNSNYTLIIVDWYHGHPIDMLCHPIGLVYYSRDVYNITNYT